MSNSSQIVTLRNILLCILVFLGAWLFPIVAGAVIAVLLYITLQYRSKIKQLEGSGESKEMKGTKGSSEPQPSSEP